LNDTINEERLNERNLAMPWKDATSD